MGIFLTNVVEFGGEQTTGVFDVCEEAQLNPRCKAQFCAVVFLPVEFVRCRCLFLLLHGMAATNTVSSRAKANNLNFGLMEGRSQTTANSHTTN